MSYWNRQKTTPTAQAAMDVDSSDPFFEKILDILEKARIKAANRRVSQKKLQAHLEDPSQMN